MPTTCGEYMMYESKNYTRQYTTTILSNEIDCYCKNKRKIKFFLKCAKWLWKNRDWQNTRQKFKAMGKECKL